MRVSSAGVPRDPEDRRMRWNALRAALEPLSAQHFDLVHIHTPFIAHYAGTVCAPQSHTGGRDLPHLLRRSICITTCRDAAPARPRAGAKLYALAVQPARCHRWCAFEPMRALLSSTGSRRAPMSSPHRLAGRSLRLGDGARFRAQSVSRPIVRCCCTSAALPTKKTSSSCCTVRRAAALTPGCHAGDCGRGAGAHATRKAWRSNWASRRHPFRRLSRSQQGLLDCYAAANVFVFASRTETQGLVLLEAMAQGAPVVSTAELGTRSVLKAGCGALVVEERQRTEFAAAVIRVLKSGLAEGARRSSPSVADGTGQLDGAQLEPVRQYPPREGHPRRSLKGSKPLF